MADDGTMDPFEALYRDLETVTDALKEDREERGRLALAELPDNPLLGLVADKFQHLLEKPGRKKESRDAVLSGSCSTVAYISGNFANRYVYRQGSY